MISILGFEEAITAHQDAAAIYRETGDRHSEGTALTNLGPALQQVRRIEEAITAHQDAAAIYRETGDRHSEGGALTNLGFALREKGNLVDAGRSWELASEAFTDAGALEDAESMRRLLQGIGRAARP